MLESGLPNLEFEFYTTIKCKGDINREKNSGFRLWKSEKNRSDRN